MTKTNETKYVPPPPATYYRPWEQPISNGLQNITPINTDMNVRNVRGENIYTVADDSVNNNPPMLYAGLPKEYTDEIKRQNGFRVVQEHFEAIDNAAGKNLLGYIGLGNDNKFIKEDLEAFLKKNKDNLTDEEIEGIEFLIDNFDKYTDKKTFGSKEVNAISKERVETALTPVEEGGDLRKETDMSLWPGYVKDEETGFPIPSTPPLNTAEETWEKQLETNKVYEKYKNVGDGTTPSEGMQAENYLRMLAHKEGLDSNLVLDIISTDAYAKVAEGGNWHEDAQADVAKLKEAYKQASADKGPGTTEEKTPFYYNTEEGIGYINNKPFKLELAEISGDYKMRPDAASAFTLMAAEAAKEGIDLTVNDAFRTKQQQQDRKDKYGNGAATPGYSNHQSGISVDIQTNGGYTSKEYEWLKANAARFGFYDDVKNPPEPWHWTYVGIEEAQKRRAAT